jgi:hypothetical protein
MKPRHRANRLMAHLFSERSRPMFSQDSSVSADDRYLCSFAATRLRKGGEATGEEATTSEEPRCAVLTNGRPGLFL